jgi:nucleoside triphosphatase
MTQKYPVPTVAALIFNYKQEIFLVKTHKWYGKYGLPGGKVELGEKLEEALKREIKEETNLDIFDIQFALMQEFIFGKEFYKKRHFIFLDYTAKTETKNVKLNSEAEDYIWVNPEKALDLELGSSTRNLIKYCLELKD